MYVEDIGTTYDLHNIIMVPLLYEYEHQCIVIISNILSSCILFILTVKFILA